MTYNGQENIPYGAAKAQALVNGPYYQVPVEPAVIAYNQNVEVPITYELSPQGPISAQSLATSNGISDTSLSTVSTNGAGIAESNAQTQEGAGTYGVTSTNAKSYGGPGSAASKANTGYGTASSNAQSQGHGFAASNAATNGANAIYTPVVNEELAPAVIAAKYHGYRNVYSPPSYGSASSIANTNGQYGSAASSAKTQATRRSIHWHFGTAYDIPAGYAKSAANTYGYGSANANSNVNSGLGIAKTAANTQGQGYADANANIHNPSYAYIRSEPVVAIGYGTAQTSANTNGYGSADANAGQGLANSAAKSHGHGSANANANLNNPSWGVARIQGAPWDGKALTTAQTSGNGSANSSARGVNTAYKVVNSNANSAGWGAARAGATSY